MLTPQQRAWVERQRAWGARAGHVITRQRSELLSADTHGLERFTTRMALVELTGRVARWAGALHDGLIATDQAEAAAAFAVGPPFATADFTASDYDLLEEYVDARMEVLRDLLAAEGS
jgi:hypothetical protein